ncbi:MAG: chromate resistance protein ChrB domain-containing protein [Gemmatimonadales bacterium]
MLWVTRSRIRVNRAATGWLIRRFIDPSPSFRFVDPAAVARVEREECAVGFDAPGARYPHKDAQGRCSFEALAQEYRPGDSALRQLARIVHCADFPDQPPLLSARPAGHGMGMLDRISLVQQSEVRSTADAAVEAVGLRSISYGFPLVAADDDETLERSGFLYDALYASLLERRHR